MYHFFSNHLDISTRTIYGRVKTAKFNYHPPSLVNSLTEIDYLIKTDRGISETDEYINRFRIIRNMRKAHITNCQIPVSLSPINVVVNKERKLQFLELQTPSS